MREWWPFKKKGMQIGEPIKGKLDDKKLHEELVKQGFAEDPAYAGAARPVEQSAKGELQNPAAGVTAAGAAGVTGGVATAGSGASAGSSGGSSTLVDASGMGAASGGMLGLLGAGDGLIRGVQGLQLGKDAELFGDSAAAKQAKGMKQDAAAAGGQGVIGATRGAFSLADVAQGGAAASLAGAAPTAAAFAAGGLGAVAGVALIGQGSWRGYKAVTKFCAVSKQKMLSEEGKRWKGVIAESEKYKIAVNSFKTSLGTIGVGSTVLVVLLASNPIGWALGLAAAIAGAGYAGTKIAAGAYNASEKSSARAAEANQMHVAEPTDVLGNIGGGEMASGVVSTEKKYGKGGTIPAGPQNERQDRGAGYSDGSAAGAAQADGAGPSDEFAAQRKAALAEAARLDAIASGHAKIAAELREALSHGDKETVGSALEAAAGNTEVTIDALLTRSDDRRLHDAFVLLTSINIDPEVALADSGQLVIEQKLSIGKAM
jgi:hypothetical protein